MKKYLLVISIVFVFCLVNSNVFAEGNADKGAALFKKNCKVCHKTGGKTKLSKEIKGLKLDQVKAAIAGESKTENKKYKMMVKQMKKKTFTDQDVEDMTAFLNK